MRYARPSVCDGAYHALALAVSGVFLMADAVYFRRAKQLGRIDAVAPMTAAASLESLQCEEEPWTGSNAS